MGAASSIRTRSGAQALVDGLINAGIDTMFGLPGDSGVVFYDALARRQEDVRYVLARDERHASYMADAYARSSRKLAACEASSGAGAVYLASGLAEAFASSIPVLAVTSDIHQRSAGSGAITEIDQLALFSAVTKWRRLAQRASDIPALVREAVRVATSGRPGPVALVIPENVLEDEIPDDVHAESLSVGIPRERLEADPAEVAYFAGMLASARRPVIFAGGGVHMSGASGELTRLAEHAAVPVATTIHGKGAIDERHPLALGVGGGNGCRGYANDYLAAADVVLIVGSRANSTDTNGFTTPPRNGPRIGQIDIDSYCAGRNFPTAVSLVGDAATVLRQLRERLPAAESSLRDERTAAIADARANWDRQVAATDDEPGGGRLSAAAVITRLHQVLGAECRVVGDPGTPTPYLAAYWDSAGYGWPVMIPRGHGPMGYSISAAIGVALAHPGERVLCVTTESSLAMGIADWETALRLRLPITYVVFDNVSLGWIKMLQHLYMDKRYFGVDPGPIFPVALAQGMGLPAETAKDLDHLDRLAKDSVDREGPSVIHVRVPEHHDAPPPVAPWQAALSGASASRPVY